MPKMIFLCRRRPDITHDDYARMVLDDHVPLAIRHHPTMAKYVVNIVDHAPAAEAQIDSVAELSFASLADFRDRLYDSAEGQRIIGADVVRFMGGADAYATTEHIHREIPAAAPLGRRHDIVKMVCPIRRRDGMTHQEFVEHWLQHHRPLALRHHTGLVRYVANVVDQRMSDESPQWDGIGELYFANHDSLRNEMFDSPAGEAIIREDIDRFIGHTFAYLVSEYVQKRP